MTATKRGGGPSAGNPPVPPAGATLAEPSAPGAAEPARKTRHGLYFFLLFGLPLILLFLYAILRNAGQ